MRICLLLLFIAFQLMLNAQEGAMSSDRPGSTYSTAPLNKGEFQIQAGLSYNYISDETSPLFIKSSRNIFQPTVNLRYGLFEKLELECSLPQQLEFVSITDLIGERNNFNYLNGVGIFSRVALLRENEKGWSMGTRFGFQYDSFSRLGTTANVDLSAQKNFTNGLGVSSTLSYFHLFENELFPNSQWLQFALNANYGLAGKINVYLDVSSSFNLDRLSSEEDIYWSNYALSTGLQYIINPNLVLDAGLGIGINNTEQVNPDTEMNQIASGSSFFLSSVGVSYRF